MIEVDTQPGTHGPTSGFLLTFFRGRDRCAHAPLASRLFRRVRGRPAAGSHASDLGAIGDTGRVARAWNGCDRRARIHLGDGVQSVLIGQTDIDLRGLTGPSLGLERVDRGHGRDAYSLGQRDSFQTRAAEGRSDIGTEVSVYVLTGNAVIRVSVMSNGTQPLPPAISIAQSISSALGH